jgi:hypothetical protein
MNDKKSSFFTDWSVLPATENVPATCLTQNDDIKHQDIAHIILTGIENDVKGFTTSDKASTIDFENNRVKEKTTSYSQNPRPTGIKKSLENISRYNKHLKESSYYSSIKQYHGIVQSIDEGADIFTASLINIEDENEELLAEFSLQDDVYGSDRELIQLGANFIWLIGQEVEHGTARNIAKFIFRRTYVARGKVLQEAKDNARELSELFDRIGATETAGDK